MTTPIERVRKWCHTNEGWVLNATDVAALIRWYDARGALEEHKVQHDDNMILAAHEDRMARWELEYAEAEAYKALHTETES
jgi:uncharacterized protein YcfL